MTTQSLGAEIWKTHWEAWKQSNLTKAEYCAAQGLSKSTLGHWFRRLAAAQNSPLTLIPVRTSTSCKRGGISLHSPSGWRIELSESDSAWIADFQQIVVK